MAKKDAAGTPILNARDEVKRVAARRKPGRTIRVRATQRGYYGRPLESLRETGDVFDFAVADLQPAGSTAKREVVAVDDVKYDLPSWVTLASNPVEREADDDGDDEDEDEANDLPTRRGGGRASDGGVL